MLNAAAPLAALMRAPARPGVVRWIGLRPGRHQPLRAVQEAVLDPQTGLQGDHYSNRTTRTRQVTLIDAAALAAIASYLGLDRVAPERLRRNIVVQGFNLPLLKGEKFRLGTAVLEGTGLCHPCSRMEAEFGPGGYNAVRGHGGLTARILTPGHVAIGAEISFFEDFPIS